MKRCPKCNCGVEFTNKSEYYAKHAGGGVLGMVAGMSMALFHPNHGGPAAKEVYENVTKNVKKHYKCTNYQCNYEWNE